MKFWKVLVMMAIQPLRTAGELKKAEDSNSTGKDDAQGIAMIFAADLLEAIVYDKALPKAPENLR